MSVEITWSPAAVADLDAIWEWIAIENGEVKAADSTVEAILDRADELASFPRAATPLDSICRIRSDWRFVEARGYLVFFRTSAGRVYVDRVLSGKSDYLRKLFGVDNGMGYYRQDAPAQSAGVRLSSGFDVIDRRSPHTLRGATHSPQINNP